MYKCKTFTYLAEETNENMKTQTQIQFEIQGLQEKLTILAEQYQEASLEKDELTRLAIFDYCNEETKSTNKQIKLLKWVLGD